MTDEQMMKMNSMYKMQVLDFALTIAFSLFGILLVFGLGFIFPSINPYVVIKWIVIVCAVVFAYAVLKHFVNNIMIMKMMKGMKLAKKTTKK